MKFSVNLVMDFLPLVPPQAAWKEAVGQRHVSMASHGTVAGYARCLCLGVPTARAGSASFDSTDA